MSSQYQMPYNSAPPLPQQRTLAGVSRWSHPLLWLSRVTVGLMAGLFFAFSVSVMPALGSADDRVFIDAMQRINSAIENGLFGLTFSGALIFPIAAGIVHYRRDKRAAAGWILAAAALYVVALIITMGVNIPLNDTLAAAGSAAKIADPHAVRQAFEGSWNAANTARTLACVLALGCLSVATSSRRTVGQQR